LTDAGCFVAALGFFHQAPQAGVFMKRILSVFVLFHAVSALASPQGIICREDNRLTNGSLREVILTPTVEGYDLQSQTVSSLSSRDIAVESLAKRLLCRMYDDKTPLAFCKNPEGSVVLIKERREVFLDSLEADEKKKTTKYIDISYNFNGVEKTLSFLSSHCQIFGGDA